MSSVLRPLGSLVNLTEIDRVWGLGRCGRHPRAAVTPGRYLIAAARFMSSRYAGDYASARAREVRTRAITIPDLRARQARRKALKPLLKNLLVRDPYNLPAELLPHILTWVGYDLIHNFPGEFCYQRDELWPASESDSESDTAEPYPYGI